MPMMRIWHMRMRVLHRTVPMRVAVHAFRQLIMRMHVMPICIFGVMAVGVFVLQNLMRMHVDMRFHQM